MGDYSKLVIVTKPSGLWDPRQTNNTSWDNRSCWNDEILAPKQGRGGHVAVMQGSGMQRSEHLGECLSGVKGLAKQQWYREAVRDDHSV